jgi:hypothetical protein
LLVERGGGLPRQLPPPGATAELADLLEQSRLADPGRPADDQRGGAPCREPVEQRLNERELALAGDQAGTRNTVCDGRAGGDLSPTVGGLGFARWLGVEVGGQRSSAQLELAPGGMVPSLRGIQLHGEAMGRFVGRVAVEDLIQERMSVGVPPGSDRLFGRFHRLDLPAAQQLLPMNRQPVLVHVVGEKVSRPQVQHNGYGITLAF